MSLMIFMIKTVSEWQIFQYAKKDNFPSQQLNKDESFASTPYVQ